MIAGNMAEVEKQARARKQELADEKRKTTLKTLLEDAETPQDKVAAIEAVYHQDPGMLKQHVENLTRRLTGKSPQPVVSPADAQAQRLAPLAARGKTPEQQELASYGAKLGLQQEAQLGGAQAAMKYIQSLPPEQQAQAAQLLGVSARPQYKLYKLPDGSTQYFDPSQAPAGAVAVESGAARPVVLQGPNGAIYGTEKGGKFYDAAGNELTTAAPAPKPGQPKAGVSGGKNVFGILTPSGWVDAGTQKPLSDFRPAPNYAEVAPSLRVVQVVDPNNPTSTKYVTTAEAAKTGAEGTQSIDYRMQMPTPQERGRADLAISAREQLGTMESILQNRDDLFGPVAGRELNFEEWIGSQDPDAHRFKAAARIAADHLAGVFGGRSQAALQAIYDTIGNNATNPEAAVAGLEQMNIAAARIQSRGVGPAPRAATSGSGAQKPIVQHSQSTGQYRYSTDGGKTWQPGQPPRQ
jgi:hypothetical protein